MTQISLRTLATVLLSFFSASLSALASAQETVLVSIDAVGMQRAQNFDYPSISGDGHLVVFRGFDLVPGGSQLGVYVRDLAALRTTLASVLSVVTEIDGRLLTIIDGSSEHGHSSRITRAAKSLRRPGLRLAARWRRSGLGSLKGDLRVVGSPRA
jgi:hypothetical protein